MPFLALNTSLRSTSILVCKHYIQFVMHEINIKFYVAHYITVILLGTKVIISYNMLP